MKVGDFLHKNGNFQSDWISTHSIKTFLNDTLCKGKKTIFKVPCEKGCDNRHSKYIMQQSTTLMKNGSRLGNGGTERVSQGICGFDGISLEGTHMVFGKAETEAGQVLSNYIQSSVSILHSFFKDKAEWPGAPSFMFHVDTSIIITSAPNGIFQSFHTTEPPAVRSGSTWFCELLVLKETCAGHTALNNEKCSPREAGERLTQFTDAPLRASGKRVSQKAFPHITLRRNMLNTRDLKFKKFLPLNYKFLLLLFKRFQFQRLPFIWYKRLFQGEVLRAHLKLIFIYDNCQTSPSLFGPDHKNTKMSSHYSMLDVMLQSVTGQSFLWYQATFKCKCCHTKQPQTSWVNVQPALLIHAVQHLTKLTEKKEAKEWKPNEQIIYHLW